MSAAVMRHTMIVRHPDTEAPMALVEGEPVPDWAEGLVHTDDTLTPDAPGDPGGQEQQPAYDSLTKADLEVKVAERNEGRDEDDLIEVGGKGNKSDLVAALEADDAAHAGDDTDQD